MSEIRGWAVRSAKHNLEPFAYDAGPLGREEGEIAVEYGGLCHSGLSTVNNDWGLSQYPVIPRHEAGGRIVAPGEYIKGLRIGQCVGVGWNADSCMHCHQSWVIVEWHEVRQKSRCS
jgi:alcohol/geraniol dehydrogenase (NADP+)